MIAPIILTKDQQRRVWNEVRQSELLHRQFGMEPPKKLAIGLDSKIHVRLDESSFQSLKDSDGDNLAEILAGPGVTIGRF